MNRPVLVTGASGFVGAHLALYLAARGHEVIALGGKNPCPGEVARRAARIAQCDLTQPGAAERILVEYEPGAVIHAAALATGTRCQADPDTAERQNVLATAALLESAARRNESARPFFLFISTDMVFDGTEAPAGGLSETDAPLPVSVYSTTKRRAEQLVLASPLDAAVIRTALVYGAPVGGLHGFMSWLLDGLRRGACTLYSDEFRTPVWSEDLCRAAECLLNGSPGARGSLLDEPGTRRIVHAGGADRLSRVELGTEVARSYGLDPGAIVPASRFDHPSPVPRPGDIGLSSAKLERRLGIRPVGFASALERTVPRSDQ